MVTNRRKKVVKYRAHTSHGCGHHKKRRGKGSRGGKGRAGSGKRAGHKRHGIVLGQRGFLPRRSAKPINAINIGYFTEERLNKLVGEGQAVKKTDQYLVNLKKIGFDKLLSAGTINNKIIFTVAYCSQKTAEKVAAAGGKVELSEVKSEVKSEAKLNSEEHSEEP